MNTTPPPRSPDADTLGELLDDYRNAPDTDPELSALRERLVSHLRAGEPSTDIPASVVGTMTAKSVTAALAAVEAPATDTLDDSELLKLAVDLRTEYEQGDDAWVSVARLVRRLHAPARGVPDAEPPYAQEVRDLMATVKLAAMDGYNEKPVTTVEDWMEEVKKRVFLLVQAASRSSGVEASEDAKRLDWLATVKTLDWETFGYFGIAIPIREAIDAARRSQGEG